MDIVRERSSIKAMQFFEYDPRDINAYNYDNSLVQEVGGLTAG